MTALNRRSTIYSFSIAIVYVLIASLWIYFSDLVHDVLFSEEVIKQFQTYKGLFFVLVTGFVLYVTIRRLYQQIEQREVFYPGNIE